MSENQSIPSLMTEDESKALSFWAVKALGQTELGTIPLACEVGSWHGASTKVIAEHFKVWSIDLGGNIFHGTQKPESIGGETWPSFLSNMAEGGLIPDRVVPICSTSDSLSAIAEPLFDFVLIDADHSYEWCGRDMENLARLMRPNAIMAVHDYLPERDTDVDYGVRDAVDDFMENNPEWLRIDFVGSLIFLSRMDYQKEAK